MYLSDFSTVIISSSTFPCIILFFIQTYPTKWLFAVFAIHVFASFIIFYQNATIRTCSNSWSFNSNFSLLNFIIHFKWFIPRARFQILILRDITPFVSTNIVVWADPFFTKKWTKITIIASWTSHSSSFKVSLKKIFLTFWALNCKLTDPVFTQTIFKLLNLLFCKHSNFSAKTKIPFALTMCSIGFIGRTYNFINITLHQTFNVLSHVISANNMTTWHSGRFSLTTNLILFIGYNQPFDLIQLTFQLQNLDWRVLNHFIRWEFLIILDFNTSIIKVHSQNS